MRKLKLGVATFIVAVLGVFAVLSPTPTTMAQSLQDTCNESNSGDNLVCRSANNSNNNVNTLIRNIVNVLLFIIGAVAVVMLIWGGIRYVTSAGNASSVTAAKNIITYSIVGLVVAFLAYAIVNWVFTRF